MPFRFGVLAMMPLQEGICFRGFSPVLACSSTATYLADLAVLDEKDSLDRYTVPQPLVTAIQKHGDRLG